MRDLRKSFLAPSGARLKVLRGVSLDARPGETLAVMGASGAGKSTLLQLLGGLEAADSGSITLGQFDVARAGPKALARFRSEHVGFVFQFHHLLPDLTAAENVSVPLMIRRVARKETLDKALAFLEKVGLKDRADHAAGQLSGGEQQRVAVARALITEPRLVLADEPTGNLDKETGDEITAALASYCRTHDAIVIVATHNETLARGCDRTLLLREGKLD